GESSTSVPPTVYASEASAAPFKTILRLTEPMVFPFSIREQVRPDLAHRAHARELHGAHQLVAQDMERARRARLARRPGSVEPRAAEHHALGAESERLDDVHAAAHSSVHEHAYPALDCAHDRRKSIERRHRAG